MSSPYITFQSGPSKANQNQTIPSELINDPAVQDAIDQINRRFQAIETRFDVLNIARSAACPLTTVTGPSAAFSPVQNLSIPIATHGRDVFVGLQFDGSKPMSLGTCAVSGTIGSPQVILRFLRDNVPAWNNFIATTIVTGTGDTIHFPPGSFWFIDQNVPVGTHIYDFQAWVSFVSSNFIISGVQMVAYELGI